LGTLRWRFNFRDDVPQVGFSPDGKAVLCCNSDGLVAFRRSDGKRLPLPEAATKATRFHFPPGGKELLLVCPNRDIRATSATVRRYTWPELRARPGEQFNLAAWGFPAGFAFSRDGKRVVARTYSGRPVLYTLGGTGTTEAEVICSDSKSVEFTPD